MPTRLSQLDIPRESLPTILEHSLKNFNADPEARVRARARPAVGRAAINLVKAVTVNREAMDDLKVGMKDTLEWEVTERLTTARGEFKVFSTPSMCLLAEMVANFAWRLSLGSEGSGRTGAWLRARGRAQGHSKSAVMTYVTVCDAEANRRSGRITARLQAADGHRIGLRLANSIEPGIELRAGITCGRTRLQQRAHR